MGELINLCSEPSSSIHDQSPQVCTRSHTAYIQAIFIALLHMLGQPWISHIVVVPALPNLVSSHWITSITGPQQIAHHSLIKYLHGPYIGLSLNKLIHSKENIMCHQKGRTSRYLQSYMYEIAKNSPQLKIWWYCDNRCSHNLMRVTHKSVRPSPYHK